MTTPRRSCRPAVAGLIGLALFAAVFGCALPGVLAYKFFPPTVPARYTPPKDQPVVVLVEAGQSPGASVPEAEELLQALHADLEKNKVAPMVDLARVHDLRDREGRGFSKLSISEIGRRVGARQVIYVDLTHCDLHSDPGSDVYKLRLSAKVKVIDAQTAQTLWPDAEGGEPFEYETQPTRATTDANSSTIKREALKLTGNEIARMFYKWSADTMREEHRDMRLR
ncbi:MAG TPA: hypothetical protein VEA69_22660 [Tepidisphaeraceae bacterium]|nr:hypothetical protein [Tepidisphaeraceae bacterium]